MKSLSYLIALSVSIGSLAFGALAQDAKPDRIKTFEENQALLESCLKETKGAFEAYMNEAKKRNYQNAPGEKPITDLKSHLDNAARNIGTSENICIGLIRNVCSFHAKKDAGSLEDCSAAEHDVWKAHFEQTYNTMLAAVSSSDRKILESRHKSFEMTRNIDCGTWLSLAARQVPGDQKEQQKRREWLRKQCLAESIAREALWFDTALAIERQNQFAEDMGGDQKTIAACLEEKTDNLAAIMKEMETAKGRKKKALDDRFAKEARAGLYDDEKCVGIVSSKCSEADKDKTAAQCYAREAAAWRRQLEIFLSNTKLSDEQRRLQSDMHAGWSKLREEKCGPWLQDKSRVGTPGMAEFRPQIVESCLMEDLAAEALWFR